LIDKQIDYTMLFLFLLIMMMHFSNFLIKTSMHTALNVFAAALFFAENKILGWMWLGIAIIVGITRVILKRHTPPEVFVGFLLALIMSFAHLYKHSVLDGLKLMKINSLTHADEQLIVVLWNLHTFYIKDVMEQPPDPKPHQNTVSTYFKILLEKGYLSA